MRKDAAWGAAVVCVAAAICSASFEPASAAAGPADAAGKTTISYADVQPLWDALQPHLPAELAGKSTAELTSTWSDWVRARDAAIRARVARGDEESLVNLWLFGTSFTQLPPARPRDVAMHGEGATLSQIAHHRLDDLVGALASPGANSRLRWARQVLAGKGVDVAASGALPRVRGLLSEVGARMLSESAAHTGALSAPAPPVGDPFAWMSAVASIYEERGLSSDTSILSSFGIDSALEALKSSRLIGARPVRRVAIVGPGLDFINKADGHDFYPEQTIQPFALIDSLIRLGLSRTDDLSVTTFDVSARVNQHLAAARDRARSGDGYVLHLPLSDVERWSPDLIRFWEGAGSRIGDVVRAARAPRSAGGVKVRAVRVRPELVTLIHPRDLNIVLERLEPPREDDLFDLVVATNVFIYYDTFEQALAVANVGRMLRSGGSLLSNQAVRPVEPMKPAVGHEFVVYSERQFDHLFWYQRR